MFGVDFGLELAAALQQYGAMFLEDESRANQSSYRLMLGLSVAEAMGAIAPLLMHGEESLVVRYPQTHPLLASEED